jgi:hypothetical protein
VQVAWLDPVDWSDLSLYAFLALENAVVAAADSLGISWERTHPSKVAAAQILYAKHGLPDIADLLVELNSLRKAEAYGEVRPSQYLEPEEVAVQVEGYVEAVGALLGIKP